MPRRFLALLGRWIRNYLELYGQLGVPLPGPFFGGITFYSNPILYRQLAERARNTGPVTGNVRPMATGTSGDGLRESSFARMRKMA
ncbi:MAG TPA: hypothetical protein VJX23_02425 [Candidatus Binataceae bacterium]|nr:hypothetical protein [Candidatus Binataceae bacterium]